MIAANDKVCFRVASREVGLFVNIVTKKIERLPTPPHPSITRDPE